MAFVFVPRKIVRKISSPVRNMDFASRPCFLRLIGLIALLCHSTVTHAHANAILIRASNLLTRCMRSQGRSSGCYIQVPSGDFPWKEHLTASTSTGKVRIRRMRQVWPRDRMRSTQRSPFSLAVPRLDFLHSTANRNRRPA